MARAARKVRRARGYKAKCDTLFSRIVRSVGACERCGKTDNLQCCHIISRTYSSTRCLRQNAFCGCAGCHLYLTKWPIEMADFVLFRMSRGRYNELKDLAESGVVVDWKQTHVKLLEYAKRKGIVV